MNIAKVILKPIADDWSWLDTIFSKLDQDFMNAAHEPIAQQERPHLNELFE